MINLEKVDSINFIFNENEDTQIINIERCNIYKANVNKEIYPVPHEFVDLLGDTFVVYVDFDIILLNIGDDDLKTLRHYMFNEELTYIELIFLDNTLERGHVYINHPDCDLNIFDNIFHDLEIHLHMYGGNTLPVIDEVERDDMIDNIAIREQRMLRNIQNNEDE